MPTAFEDGLRQVAAGFGLCVAIDIPFDAAHGRLKGFGSAITGGLDPIDIAVAP
jgi:hypothetical protein